MTKHPSPVAQAFDVIHEHVRAVERQNGELRMKNNQKDAAVDLIARERDDLRRQVAQLRGQLSRITCRAAEVAASGILTTPGGTPLPAAPVLRDGALVGVVSSTDPFEVTVLRLEGGL